MTGLTSTENMHAGQDTRPPIPPQQRRLRLLLIPPEQWQPSRDGYVPGKEPAQGLIDRLLADFHGIDIELLDPHGTPLNPFGRMHPVYRGMDPLRALSVLLRYRSVDMVVSVFESSALLPLLLRRIFRFKPKIALWDIAPDEVWKIRRWVQNRVVPRVDHIFLLSADQQGYMARRWGKSSHSSVIWQHVDTEFFAPVQAPQSGPVLAIGDDHGRDWQTLIAAVGDLDIDLVIKTRHKLDLSAVTRCRIRQISERIDYPQLRQLYAECSFVVIPLKNTLNVSGVGSVLESMAMGKALVISDNPPIRDYLAPDQTCKVTPVGDAAALRAAIVELHEQPARREQLGQQARRHATERFSKPAFAKRFAEHIRAALANTGQGG